MSIISAIVIGMGWVILISNIMPSMLYSTDYISTNKYVVCQANKSLNVKYIKMAN